MKYLVTGSTGIVGKYLVKELKKDLSIRQIVSISRKYRYKYDENPDVGVERDLLCYANLLLDPFRLISQFKPTHIFHCAGEGQQNTTPKELWRANVDTTLNLLEACRRVDNYKPRFILCSSIMAGTNDSMYAVSKSAAEGLVHAYSDSVAGTIIRFPAVAGAGNKHGVVKAIVDKLLDKSSDKLNLLTNSIKPLIYAGQLAQHMIVISKLDSIPLVELSSPDTISVSSIAVAAMLQIGIVKDIVWSNTSWKIDSDFVPYRDSYLPMHATHQATKLAIEDILENYNYVK